MSLDFVSFFSEFLVKIVLLPSISLYFYFYYFFFINDDNTNSYNTNKNVIVSFFLLKTRCVVAYIRKTKCLPVARFSPNNSSTLWINFKREWKREKKNLFSFIRYNCCSVAALLYRLCYALAVIAVLVVRRIRFDVSVQLLYYNIT